MTTQDARSTREIKSRTAIAIAAFNMRETLFNSKLDFNSAKKVVNSATCGAQLGMVLKLGHFGKSIKNTWKVTECGAAEGWKR
jgi:hypothetical protein